MAEYFNSPASKVYEGEGGYPHYEAISNIILTSPGWSGNVIRTDALDDEDRSFMFKVSGSMTNLYVTPTPNYSIRSSNTGHVAYNSTPVIIGISLEHFGKLIISGDHEINQLRGYVLDEYYNPNLVPAFGAEIEGTELYYDDGHIIIDTVTVTDDGVDTEYSDVAYRNVSFPAYEYSPFYADLYPEWTVNMANNSSGALETDLPIFATDADLLEFCQSGGTITNKMLNYTSAPDPEDVYNEQFDFWFIKSVSGHNTRNSQASGLTVYNYRFFPKNQGICFKIVEASENSPYTLELRNSSSYQKKSAGRGEDDDSAFVEVSSVPTNYLDRSISFGADNYYTSFEWLSNIPRFYTDQECTDYLNNLIDISSAANYSEIARIDNSIIQSEWTGLDIDSETSLGTNGMQYGYGNRLYAITNLELSSLFNELFDPANLQDILDGTKLFGAASDCVTGIMYLPIHDIDEICNTGSLANIYIGNWQAQNSQGKRIINNNKLINCGSFVMAPSYNDFRDLEPYTLLYVMLPMVGFKQLTISKYLGKTVTVKYAIDVTTGACVAMILADNKLLDIFEGTAGASRPFSAIDNNGYINQIIGSITGASNTAAGSIAGVSDAVGAASKAAGSSAALGAVGVAGVGVAGAGFVASGIYEAYKLQQAVDNPPIMSHGSLAGNLSYYTMDKVTFVIAKKRTIRPENELAVIGYPSGHGGAVGQFNGFLACSAFKLADGFLGTEAERTEIIEIMKGGVYID